MKILFFPNSLTFKVFLNKSYEVIISVHDVNSKVLSHESNYILAAVM